MSRLPPMNPIEGFFIQSDEGLIFDVKGLSHPSERIISFVRYIPEKFIDKNENEIRNGYLKIYNLNSRFAFLQENFPHYIFKDPRGRGMLQGVRNNQITLIYDPRKRLQEMQNSNELDALEQLTLNFITILRNYTKMDQSAFGITGSLLVKLHTENSDIDIVIYGRKNGNKIYKMLPLIFDRIAEISKYTKEDLKDLWENRGQTNQIEFESFFELERGKLLQGKYCDKDFYIRLVPYPDEFGEDYLNTTITYLGEIEIIGSILENKEAIFTPSIYQLKDVKIIKSTSMSFIKPARIFSVRGRYCELVGKNTEVHIQGKLEQVILGKESIYQITLGANENEFFKKR